MMRLMVQTDQHDLLTGLRALFPDLYLDKYAEGEATYMGTFAEGAERIRQQEFLYQHAIRYIDVTVEQQRTLLIQSFFHGVELEGNLITGIDVRPLLSTLNYYGAALHTHEDDTVVLRFTPSWTPFLYQQENDYLGWLYVSEGQHNGERMYEAALIGTEQRPIEVLKRTATAEQMVQWLEECVFTQSLCTTLAPGVCGLYKKL